MKQKSDISIFYMIYSSLKFYIGLWRLPNIILELFFLTYPMRNNNVECYDFRFHKFNSRVIWIKSNKFKLLWTSQNA